MTRSKLSLAARATVVALVAFSAWPAPSARAGGPLLTIDGRPVTWSHGPVTGPAPLNSQTVDATGRVLYHVDSGTLGPLSNEQAVALVDRIFGLYNGVETSTIRFANAGPILDPSTGQPVDVTARNVGRFLGNDPTFQNPIVFDSDGGITGRGGVLGFFSFLQFGDDGSLQEGTVVLNGAAVSSVGGAVPFGGVFTHEFGHFAGPLDHEQSNGNIAADGNGAELPFGYSEADAYDLYAPYTETLFPFLFGAPSGSRLAANGYGNSGFFTATLDMDTKNALSNLYPAPGYRTTDSGSPNGSITGRVVIRTSGGDIPITGINVVARRISQGTYPPAPGTTAYPNNVVSIDGSGVPLPPPARPETDPLVTVESAVTGQGQPDGSYSLDGLPPGDYLVQIQQINPNALGGSGIGPLGQQIPIPVIENYNGSSESGDASDDPDDFTAVTVTAGTTTSNVDVVLNGFPTTALQSANEKEPNEKVKKAQLFSSPVEVMGRVSSNDSYRTLIDFGSQGQGPIQDFYRFKTDRTVTVFVSLAGTTQSGDIDLYLLGGKIGRVISIDDARVIASSTSPTANEFVAVQLEPGTYTIGVSGFDGTVPYALRVLTTS